MRKLTIFFFIFNFMVLHAQNYEKMFDPNSYYLYQGKIKASFYSIIDENQFASSRQKTVLLNNNGNVIINVKDHFAQRLAKEGNGRLLDGRVVNFTKRVNDKISCKIVERAPFGLGIKNFKLIPWRTVAVDPHKILIGSVLFIPQAVGMPLPDGTFHDGYFLAHDAGKQIKEEHIDFFVGFQNGTTNNFIKSGKIKNLQDVDVYVVGGIMDRVIRLRFSRQFRWKNTKRTWEMTASDFNQLMADGKKIKLIKDRIQYYSELGKGTPYLIFNMGEGPHNDPDPDPLMDFGRTDCMLFCEHTLALSVSNNYSQMFDNLQKIRYKNGKISYTLRNHFTIADWLPNNNWMLEDITEDIGKGLTKEIIKKIDRKGTFKDNGVSESDLNDTPDTETMKVKYIPTKNLLKIKNKLQGGEIVSIITTIPGVFSIHMGIIAVDEWGNVIFRHASGSKRVHEVKDVKFEEYIAELTRSKSRIGMIFMRAKDDYKIPQ